MTTTAAISCPTHPIKQTVAPAAAGATAGIFMQMLKIGSSVAIPPPSVPLLRELTDSSDAPGRSLTPLNPVHTLMSHIFSFQNPLR